jgi:DNA helicase IV
MIKGQESDVRIFEIEHIKGLEFEAVFFMDVDELRQNQPELFERYIYVGATRAATFLGLTCSGNELPDTLQPIGDTLLDSW